jgi:transposase
MQAIRPLIEPHIPPPPSCGRTRETSMRKLVNAIFCIAPTGCQRCLLPKNLPPYTTVQRYFYAWRDSSVWQTTNHVLLMEVREAAGRKGSPTVGVIDSQSVTTAESGDPRGYAVDTNGNRFESKGCGQPRKSRKRAANRPNVACPPNRSQSPPRVTVRARPRSRCCRNRTMSLLARRWAGSSRRLMNSVAMAARQSSLSRGGPESQPISCRCPADRTQKAPGFISTTSEWLRRFPGAATKNIPSGNGE